MLGSFPEKTLRDNKEKRRSVFMAKKGYRVESDSMGEMTVPSHVYYGAQTARAIENFPISQKRLQVF